MTLPIGIPIRVFVQLEKLAQVALDCGDAATMDWINERLATINARFIVRDGELFMGVVDQSPEEGKPY